MSMRKYDDAALAAAHADLKRMVNSAPHEAFEAIYQVAKHTGENSPVAIAMRQNCEKFAEYYNTEYVPKMTKALAELEANEEYNRIIKNQQAGEVKTSVDLGTVRTTNFDAARNL